MVDYTNVLAPSLTSHEAHNRLLVELQTFYDKRSQLKISKVLFALWPTLLNSGFLALATLHIGVLLPYLSQKDSLFDFTHLIIQLIVTLLCVLLNVALELYEIQIKSLWHIRRCMSHSDNFMGQTPCPWESTSYPTHPITTLRSQITTRGLRDRTLVNIPCSLLVKGDIIQLHSNTPSPAHVKGLSSGSGRILKIGETPNSRSVSFQGSRRTKTIIEEDEYSWYKVVKTPIIQLLEKSLDSSPPTYTLLYRQNKLIYKIVTCLFVPIVYAISFIFALSRWAVFSDYLSWHTIILNPTYIAILLLAPSMQVVWRIMNSYGIVLYDDMLRSSPLPASGLIDKCTSSAHVFIKIFRALFLPYIYPLPDHVHSMGSITAICAVDKEFLLTGGMPKPEKVFFFRSNKQPEESEILSEVGTNMSQADDSLSGIEFECHGVSPVSQSIVDDTVIAHKNPFYSIEIAPEILGLSLNLDHSTGLSFDDPNWLLHVNSLKPIALNVFATSHMSNPFSIHCNSVSSFGLQHYLYKTQCSCPLAFEIGVSEYPYDNFDELQMMYMIRDHNHMDYHYADTFPRNRSNSLLQNLWNDFIQPHCISMLIEDRCAQQKLLMTRGTADIIVDCCQDFWDGKCLQPLTETEKQAILDFFARKTISAYCVALAYSPVSESEYSAIPSKRKSIGVYLSSDQTRNVAQNLASLDDGEVSSNLVKLLSNQVFLGMISLQYQPKQDIIHLVQSLKQSGIRFIHYTAENEVRGKLFAEKLGLEAGWNCHISLQADTNEKNDEGEAGIDKEVEDNISTSSSESSGSSIYYTNYSYIKAKLPKGVEQVRSHIETVDNVPLLVPLFTDCTPEGVTEMIKIMQENGEVVLCMGNAWVRENISILAQANIGMSLTPSVMDMGSGDCAIVNGTLGRGHHQDWPTPLEAASSLNSLTSGAYLARDADVNLISIVQQCRHTLGCIRRGLLFFLASTLSVALFCLLCGVMFQPLPLSGSHVYWFVIVTIPLLSLSLLPISVDDGIIMQLPDRKNIVINSEWKHYIVYFSVIYVPMSLVCLAIYWLSLNELCSSIDNATCDVFLGNTNSTDDLSLGWQDTNAIGYLLAQNVTVMFLTIYLACSTTLFIHHFKPIWKSLKFVTWQYVAILVLVLVLQVIFFTFSQILMKFKSSEQVSFSLVDLPWFVWILGFLWVLPQGCIQEIVKYHNRKLFMKTQTRLKLSFETKLGMHSPV